MSLKIVKKCFLPFLLLISSLIYFSPNLVAFAENIPDSDSLYDSAVSQSIIDPEIYSEDERLSDEEEFMKPSYDEFKSSVSDTLSYEEWLKMNNHGVMVDTKFPLLRKKNENGIASRSAQDNIEKFCRDVKSGDILKVSGDFLTGVIGHSAIMNSDNYVLEMTRGKGWQNGIPDNNHQYTKREWLTNHISDWTSVYRISDSGLAEQVGRYADKHYYSSNDSEKKDIPINYLIDIHLKNKNPNYCSKLVYQAYYYGTGDLPVMQPSIPWGIILPTSLPFTFNPNYQPKYLDRYLF